VIAEALVALRHRAQALPSAQYNGGYADAVREMLDFVEKNHTRLQDISVKKLIHEGHRL
jgi:hypothetical protein